MKKEEINKRMAIILSITAAFAIGCTEYAIKKATVMTDKVGNEYLVKPHIGNTYSVEKIPK